MARLVYACRFEVPAERGLATVLDAYSDWINKIYKVRRGVADFEFTFDRQTADNIPSAHGISLERFEVDGNSAFRLVWMFPDDIDETLRWRNEVRIGTVPDGCSVEHLIWVDSIDYKVAPTKIVLGSPAVIRKLCSEGVVRVGDMQVQAAPYPLDELGVDDFLQLLTSPLRRIPIVFLSPYASGHKNLIDAMPTAKRLAGVAVVVSVEDGDTTWDLANELGRSLSCFDGGARIYWPNFSMHADPRMHPLYLGSRIASARPSAIATSIERSIFAIASFRFVPDERVSELIRSAEESRRLVRVESQKAQSGADWETYALEIDDQLSVANARLAELESENANLRANQQVLFSSPALAESDTEIPPEQFDIPDTVSAAVEQSKSSCPHLVILDSAFESAKKSPFQRPVDIIQALKDLNDVAQQWAEQRQATGSGGDLRQHLTKRGWGKRCSMHVSDTTRTRYGSAYTFDYKGARELFEPHITLGSGDANSCASIHFIPDEKIGKLVVGHVGRHLPNTKT